MAHILRQRQREREREASHRAVHYAKGNDFIIFSKRKQFTQLAAGYAMRQQKQQLRLEQR